MGFMVTGDSAADKVLDEAPLVLAPGTLLDQQSAQPLIALALIVSRRRHFRMAAPILAAWSKSVRVRARCQRHPRWFGSRWLSLAGRERVLG
ncbi:MAG: hypothetical protein ACR2FG_06365 [Marmoricola sp.]